MVEFEQVRSGVSPSICMDGFVVCEVIAWMGEWFVKYLQLRGGGLLNVCEYEAVDWQILTWIEQGLPNLCMVRMWQFAKYSYIFPGL
jgi:hypothetical protein